VSGRAGRYVYYWAYGHLCWRVYVVPKDPRTAVQQRSRAAFAAASTAWSGSQSLTEEMRVAWHAEAAKIKSTPRLGQSGSLTAQQHFVGRNSLKERWGSAILLEPLEGEREKAECRVRTLGSATQVQQRQRVARPSSGTRRACAAPAPSLPQAARATVKKATAAICPSQLPFPQRLTRPSSGRYRHASIPLPGQRRYQARSSRHVRSIGSLRLSSTLPQIPRAARFRGHWRGG
jgi:hypothetical protein